MIQYNNNDSQMMIMKKEYIAPWIHCANIPHVNLLGESIPMSNEEEDDDNSRRGKDSIFGRGDESWL